MNTKQNLLYNSLLLFWIIFLIWFVGMVLGRVAADAHVDDFSPIYPYNNFLESRSDSLLVDYLRENSWVNARVSDDDLTNYILLAKQMASCYDNVTPGLIIAMMAVESRFNTDDLSQAGARGLMQIIPTWHRDRMDKFIEADQPYSKDLFYNPRLNIAVGTDYISEIVRSCEGDKAWALMCYNSGYAIAQKNHDNGRVSAYAKQVLSLADEVDYILTLYAWNYTITP